MPVNEELTDEQKQAIAQDEDLTHELAEEARNSDFNPPDDDPANGEEDEDDDEDEDEEEETAFFEYLEHAWNNAAIDHSLRVVRCGGGEIEFYIHPDGKNGDTLTFFAHRGVNFSKVSRQPLS